MKLRQRFLRLFSFFLFSSEYRLRESTISMQRKLHSEAKRERSIHQLKCERGLHKRGVGYKLLFFKSIKPHFWREKKKKKKQLIWRRKEEERVGKKRDKSINNRSGPGLLWRREKISTIHHEPNQRTVDRLAPSIKQRSPRLLFHARFRMAEWTQNAFSSSSYCVHFNTEQKSY